MKKLKTLMVSTVLLCGIGASNSVLANPQLAKQYKCLECHVLDKKVIGPSIRDIAQKYKGDPGAMSRLVDRVRSGSVGAWGTTLEPRLPATVSGRWRGRSCMRFCTKSPK